MKRFLSAVVICPFCFLSPFFVHAQTISTDSRQFLVSSSSQILATKASEQAETIRKNVYALTEQPDLFLTPIQIKFQNTELGDDLEDYDYIAEASPDIHRREYLILATKNSPENAKTVSWPEAIVIALQDELANRVPAKNTGAMTVWPTWFLWGITGIADEKTHEKIEKSWEIKYQRKTYRSLKQIWETSLAVSPEEKERIQALSSFLILQLQQLPDGHAKFAKLAYQINHGNFGPDVFYTLYKKDFANPKDAEQWWTKQQAYYNRNFKLASLDFSRTLSQLADILGGGLPEPGLKGLEEGDLKELNDLQKQLYELMVAGHPMVRPAVETAINALEAVRVKNMRKARPSWNNAQTILEALGPWKSEIDAVMDQWEYQLNDESLERWLKKKGVGD